MIVFDASSIVGAGLRANSVPARAFLKAAADDRFALSAEVDAEIEEVLRRPKFIGRISASWRAELLGLLRSRAIWLLPTVAIADCRDKKDDKYLALALAAQASMIVSSDADLLVLSPWRGVRILKPAEYLDSAAPPESTA